jgi:hypothetical protein
MTEKGGIFKNWQTQKGLLESKLHKNILVDCVFINSMLKMTLIINYAEQFKVPPLNTLTPSPFWFIRPCIAYWFHRISEEFYQIKYNFLS